MSSITVAKHAGVSVATVSRVLNAPGSVAPETVALVKRAMVELNYTPPAPERRRGPKLKSERAGQRKAESMRVGLWCVGTPESEIRTYFSSQLETLHFALVEAGMELKLLFSSPQEVPGELVNGTVSGVIMQGRLPSAKCLRELERYPNVWLMTRMSGDYPGDYIEPDNHANGVLAANWLAAQKARHWALFGTQLDYPVNTQRRLAFVGRGNELKVPVKIIADAPQAGARPSSRSVDEEVEAMVDRLLSITPAIDGIYMTHDRICGAFYRALRQRKKAPERFRTIIGHYNRTIYESLDPQPAAIDVNLRAIIRYAVLQLSDR
ncbi:MAG: LacI family transcriptional regulator, partial [Opitutaceae bacterium]|nr:LacI family transcriptional regulator [Opitutaceae bacterium]